MFFFDNGKAAKVTLSSYATKTNRKKLINAYSDKSPLVAAYYITDDTAAQVFSAKLSKNIKYPL